MELLPDLNLTLPDNGPDHQGQHHLLTPALFFHLHQQGASSESAVLSNAVAHLCLGQFLDRFCPGLHQQVDRVALAVPVLRPHHHLSHTSLQIRSSIKLSVLGGKAGIRYNYT